jgi:RHS repeat-associated protein
MITDGYGNPVSGGEYGGKSHISYKPYGEILRTDSGGPDITKFKYTGQVEDKETGLMYYKARYYDPMVARFTQADSMVFNDQVSGMNRYMYVSGNPIKYNDPSGHRQTRGWLGGLIHDFNKWSRNLQVDFGKNRRWQGATLGYALGGWEGAQKGYEYGLSKDQSREFRKNRLKTMITAVGQIFLGIVITFIATITAYLVWKFSGGTLSPLASQILNYGYVVGIPMIVDGIGKFESAYNSKKSDSENICGTSTAFYAAGQESQAATLQCQVALANQGDYPEDWNRWWQRKE